MKFEFKNIEKKDWDILLEWRNDFFTKEMSFNSNRVTKDEHYEYLEKNQSNDNINQYVFIYNDLYVGTMKTDNSKKQSTTLSYTINPKFRKKGYGKLMIYLFLFERKGVFLCKVKKTNFASIKMCEWNNFKLKSKEKSFLLYEKIIKK